MKVQEFKKEVCNILSDEVMINKDLQNMLKSIIESKIEKGGDWRKKEDEYNLLVDLHNVLVSDKSNLNIK